MGRICSSAKLCGWRSAYTYYNGRKEIDMKWTVGIARDREHYPTPEGSVMYLYEGEVPVVMGGVNPYVVEADSEKEAEYRAKSLFYEYMAESTKQFKEQEIKNYKRKLCLGA
jgi:hypothetical protein